MRVFELSKELGVTTMAVLDKCRGEGFELKNHMAALSADLEALVRAWFAEGTNARAKAKRGQPQGVPAAANVAPGVSPKAAAKIEVRREPGRSGASVRADAGPAVSARTPDVDPHEAVGKGMKLLVSGLGPFVEREMSGTHGSGWKKIADEALGNDRSVDGKSKRGQFLRDQKNLLFLVWEEWHLVFRKTLGKRERCWVGELREDRNQWAHNEPFSPEEGYRTLDSIRLLLGAVSATEETAKVKELMRELLPLLLRREPKT